MSADLPSSTTEDAAQDVEVLATRLMGWKRAGHVPPNQRLRGCWHNVYDQPVAWMFYSGRDPWNPFTDPRADLQVLERVREVWKPTVGDFMYSKWRCFTEALPDCWSYTVGAYARAALVVLREMEGGS